MFFYLPPAISFFLQKKFRPDNILHHTRHDRKFGLTINQYVHYEYRHILINPRYFREKRLHRLLLLPIFHEQFGKDRKSTRLNSSHANISYAVFCLKKRERKNTILFVLFRIPGPCD